MAEDEASNTAGEAPAPAPAEPAPVEPAPAEPAPAEGAPADGAPAEGGAAAESNDDPLVAAAKQRVADVLEPINGGVGEDISYDEKFDEIKNETEKLSSLTGETCDWASIGVTAEEILQEKSKDFRVACYLATCKLRQGNLDGVIDGLVLLQQMTEKFWEDMFPPLRRMRARAGMVGWMSDQAGPTMIDYPLSASDNPKVKVIDDLSKELDADFRERFGEHYPGISQLRDAVRHYLRTVPKEKKPEPKPEPKPAPAAGAAPAPRAAAAPAPGGGGGGIEVTTPEEAQRALKPLGQLMRRIAAQLRAGKPENPMAYRLLRVGSWMELESAPPAPAENKTMVPPPPPHVTGALDALAGSNDWLNLLNAAELHAGNYIFWLDAHRYAATAMGALGALFMKAKDELLLQVALLLKRVPNLPTLAFSDGTPFADGATQMWLEAEVLPVLASGEGGGGASDDGALGEALKEARDLAVKGDLGKALDAVAQAAASAGTPVDRFRGQLASAQLCLGASHHAIARSQLEGLTRQIEAHQLTSWDPALCAEVYGGLYSAIKSLNDAKRPKNPQQMAQMAQQGNAAPAVSPEDEAAERAAFEMLCRLDPAQALKLGGGK